MSVSRETAQLLDAYAKLIKKWNPAINLVARGTLQDIHDRHIEDSVQLIEAAQPETGSWVDLGSGGGLPGIVVSILTQSRDLKVTLVESDKRKAAFLQTVRRELELANLTLLADRIEALPDSNHNHASARALAPLEKLLPWLQRVLAKDGTAWLLKGRNWRDEIDAASKDWHFDCETIPSRIEADSVIMKLRGIQKHG